MNKYETLHRAEYNTWAIHRKRRSGWYTCAQICIFQSICICQIIIIYFNIISHIITILYGIGQVTQLRIQDFICENKTIDVIYKHSKENNLPKGTTSGCWISKGLKANSDILFQTRSYTSTDEDADFDDYVKFMFFIMAAMFLFYCIIMQIMFFIMDVIRFKKERQKPYTKRQSTKEAMLPMI